MIDKHFINMNILCIILFHVRFQKKLNTSTISMHRLPEKQVGNYTLNVTNNMRPYYNLFYTYSELGAMAVELFCKNS